MNKIWDWYERLQPREQRIVALGAVVLGALILIGGILLPLESKVSTATRITQTRREDVAWMRINAPEVRAAGALLAPDTGEAPMVLVDRVGREAGLGTAMRGTQPSGNGVRVQLEDAPFDTLVTWLTTLEERNGLSIESISVDRAAKPGMVNANVTFAQTRR